MCSHVRQKRRSGIPLLADYIRISAKQQSDARISKRLFAQVGRRIVVVPIRIVEDSLFGLLVHISIQKGVMKMQKRVVSTSFTDGKTNG